MGVVQEILEAMAATGRIKRPQQCLAGPRLSGPSPEPDSRDTEEPGQGGSAARLAARPRASRDPATRHEPRVLVDRSICVAARPGRRTGYTSRQCTGYTGLNTLLAVEEYGNILGYANRQQARVEPGELEVHTVLSSEFQSVSERATQAMPDLRGSNTSLFCSHCGYSQCCNTRSLINSI